MLKLYYQMKILKHLYLKKSDIPDLLKKQLVISVNYYNKIKISTVTPKT